MSRVFTYAYISLDSFLSEWEEVNRELAHLSRASFSLNPFVLFTGLHDQHHSSRGDATAPASVTATQIYLRVYQLLAGLGPVRGEKDTHPKTKSFRKDISPISPYADGDSSSCSEDDERTAQALHACVRADATSRASNSDDHHEAAQAVVGPSPLQDGSDTMYPKRSKQNKRKPRKDKASRCVYSRVELLLHLAHISIWLWVALMSRATGGRLTLPDAISSSLNLDSSDGRSDSNSTGNSTCTGRNDVGKDEEEDSLYNPFVFQLDSEHDRSLWQRTLERTVNAWIGSGLAPPSGSPNRAPEGFLATSALPTPTVEDTLKSAQSDKGDREAAGPATEPFSTVPSREHLLSLHALVTVARHYRIFEQAFSTAFLRLSIAVEEERAAATTRTTTALRRNESATDRDGDKVSGGCARSSSDEFYFSLLHCKDASPSPNAACSSGNGKIRPRAREDGVVARVLRCVMHEVLQRNEVWARAVITCAASAVIGRDEADMASAAATAVTLTSAPTTPLTAVSSVAVAQQKIRERRTRAQQQQRKSASSFNDSDDDDDGSSNGSSAKKDKGSGVGEEAVSSPTPDWWEVARYIEEFDIKHVFELHHMIEQTASLELQRWTMRVVEESCFLRGRRLLNSTLASAIPVLTSFAVETGTTPTDSGNASEGTVLGETADGIEGSHSHVAAVAAALLEEAVAWEDVGVRSSGCDPASSARMCATAEARTQTGSPLEEQWQQRPFPPPQLAKASQALRDALRAYIRLRAALMLFNAGTVHYMDSLTACGTQRLVAGVRAFTEGFCSRRTPPTAVPLAQSPTSPQLAVSPLTVSLTSGASPVATSVDFVAQPYLYTPVTYDLQQFMLIYGVPLWLQLCEKTKRLQAELAARDKAEESKRTNRKATSLLADRAKPSPEQQQQQDDGPAEWEEAHHSSSLSRANLRVAGLRGHVRSNGGDDEDDGAQATVTPPSSRAPTEAPQTASPAAGKERRRGEEDANPRDDNESGDGSRKKGPGGIDDGEDEVLSATYPVGDTRLAVQPSVESRSNLLAGTVDGKSLHDALSDTTSVKADQERQNWLRRAMGISDDEDVEEQRELQLMASLPEDGLPTLLYLLTRKESDRRRILAVFSEQVRRYMVLLLARSGRSAEKAQAATTVPLKESSPLTYDEGAPPTHQGDRPSSNGGGAAARCPAKAEEGLSPSAQPLPANVFEKCVFALHMTQSAFSRQEEEGPPRSGRGSPQAHAALAALAEAATAAVCKGLQGFFAQYECRVSLTLAHALHAQVLEDSSSAKFGHCPKELGARNGDGASKLTGQGAKRAAHHAATLQVVDTLLALASMLPVRDAFVRLYKSLMAPRLALVKSMEDLQVDAEVLSRMALRLGAATVHPCMTLLYDIRQAMTSTRGLEPYANTVANDDADDRRESEAANGDETPHRRRKRMHRERGRGDGEVGKGLEGFDARSQRVSSSPGVALQSIGDLEQPAAMHPLLPQEGRPLPPSASPTPVPTAAVTSTNHTAGGIGSLMMSSPVLGSARSPMAYAMSLLSGANTTVPASNQRDSGGAGDDSRSPFSLLPSESRLLSSQLPKPKLLRHLRVLCEAWWAPHAGPLLTSKTIRRLYEHRRYLDDTFVDAVLRTEWYYCDPQCPQQAQEGGSADRGQTRLPGNPASSSSSSQPQLMPSPFPGYGRYKPKTLSVAGHSRTNSYDSMLTDDGGSAGAGSLSAAGGAHRSPSIFSLSQASHTFQGISNVLTKTNSLVGGLRRTEHRSGAFGNDDPDDDDDDFLAAYGGVLSPSAAAPSTVSGGAASSNPRQHSHRHHHHHRRTSHRLNSSGSAINWPGTTASIDELGSVSSYDGVGALSDVGGGTIGSLDESADADERYGGSSVLTGAAPPKNGPLERRRLRWPMACGQLVYLVHPCSLRPETNTSDGARKTTGGGTGKKEQQQAERQRLLPFQVTGPPISLLLLQLIDRASEPVGAGGGGGGLPLSSLCERMPVPTPKPIVAAMLKTFLRAGLVQRRVDPQVKQHVYYIPDTFTETAPAPGAAAAASTVSSSNTKKKLKVVVDITAVLQQLPPSSLHGEKQGKDHGDVAAQPLDSRRAASDAHSSGFPRTEAESREEQTDSYVAESGSMQRAQQQQLLDSASPPSVQSEKHLMQVAEVVIIRLLKKQMSMSHTALAEAVAEQLGDKFTAVLFKNAVGHLLERDYLRRDEEEKAYVYVP